VKNHTLAQHLQAAARQEKISFHTPGHKGGPDTPSLEAALDTTEIPGTDNLHHPTGILREAQKRAQDFYGSEETFFLVNGSTCGVAAMILGALKPGEELLMNRNAHQSVYHACLLGNITPRYLVPGLDPVLGLPLGVDAPGIEKALDQWPQVKAVLVTRPTYHGYAPDLKAVDRVVKAKGKLLLVDEAHGAHLRLSPDLPADAMASGADAAVQSTHKTLTALTQSAMLHVQGSGLDRERLKMMLRLFQTSSPSYLLMNSLDEAVTLAKSRGSGLMSVLLQEMAALRRRLTGVTGLLFSGNPGDVSPLQALDPTRLWIDLHGTGLGGYELDRKLRENWGIQTELSDLRGVLALATIGNKPSDINNLGEALLQTAAQQKDRLKTEGSKAARHNQWGLTAPIQRIPHQAMNLQEAMTASRESIPLHEAAGRISGESLIPYPPGIPLVVPGERLEADMIKQIEKLAEAGNEIIGIHSSPRGEKDAHQIRVVVTP